MPAPFEILEEISNIETFATGAGIREAARLRCIYGRDRWRKRKGVAQNACRMAQFIKLSYTWYEASGIGRREFKIKYLL